MEGKGTKKKLVWVLLAPCYLPLASFYRIDYCHLMCFFEYRWTLWKDGRRETKRSK